MSNLLTDAQVALSKPRAITPQALAMWMTWHGIGQTELAKVCLVSRRTVYNWLYGVHAIPRTVAPRLAQVFGAPYVPDLITTT
jgi:predicted transcriptional regulator